MGYQEKPANTNIRDIAGGTVALEIADTTAPVVNMAKNVDSYTPSFVKIL